MFVFFSPRDSYILYIIKISIIFIITIIIVCLNDSFIFMLFQKTLA
jgi:hypothetical protein